jgi:hypothetical protein
MRIAIRKFTQRAVYTQQTALAGGRPPVGFRRQCPRQPRPAMRVALSPTATVRTRKQDCGPSTRVFQRGKHHRCCCMPAAPIAPGLLIRSTDSIEPPVLRFARRFRQRARPRAASATRSGRQLLGGGHRRPSTRRSPGSTMHRPVRQVRRIFRHFLGRLRRPRSTKLDGGLWKRQEPGFG